MLGIPILLRLVLTVERAFSLKRFWLLVLLWMMGGGEMFERPLTYSLKREDSSCFNARETGALDSLGVCKQVLSLLVFLESRWESLNLADGLISGMDASEVPMYY